MKMPPPWPRSKGWTMVVLDSTVSLQSVTVEAEAM
jgi:hypothetical protein